MTPVLSIIVPVYNVEEYINECIDSILGQTFRDFELILVNDGSTDDSYKICEKYINIDKRVILINKSNGGASSARNTGLEIAKGRFIAFVDSDDYLSQDYYYENIQYLLSNPSIDMAVMQVCRFSENMKEIKKNKPLIYNNQQEVATFLLSKDYLGSPWINLYKREIFDSIRYPEGQIFEDGFIIPDIAECVNKLFLSNIGIYYYRERNNSVMNTKFSIKNWNDILKTHIKQLNYCKYNISDKSILVEKLAVCHLAVIYAQIEYPNESFQEYIDKFQSYDFTLKQLFRSQMSCKTVFKLYVLKIIGYKSMKNIYKFFKIYTVA